MNIIKDLESAYDNVLLEKDHRFKMVNFGIPQDVADYLHEFSNKYSIWFANQFKNDPDYIKSVDKVNWIKGRKANQMRSILDWIASVPNLALKNFKWDEALEKSTKWHESLVTAKLDIKEKNTILKTYPNDLYWVDIESNYSSEDACGSGHCGRDSQADTIYSLRKYHMNTDSIEIIVTMSISPDDGIWHQCKGPKNSKPKEIYWPMIVDILIDKNVYTWKSGYKPDYDFNVDNFRTVIEDDPDKYPNSEEILKKLKEQGLEAQAAKLFKKFDFNHVYVNYDIEDYDEGTAYISANGGFNVQISNTDMPTLGYVANLIQKQEQIRKYSHNQDLIQVLIDTFQELNMYPDSDWSSSEPYNLDIENNKTILNIQFNTNIDRQSSYANDELSLFEEFLNTMDEYDSIISKPDFKQRFIDAFELLLAKANIIPEDENIELYDPMYPNTHNVPINKIPKPEPYDPNQMKLKFSENVKFKEFFNILM